ncbi:MAG: hypothetical protein HN368_02655, partial [Spirochaetales bacterium]|nr:hypothetical protein [Spirochaetales bacterium]
MKLTTIAAIQPPFFEEKSIANNQASIEKGFEYLEFALSRGADYCCLPEVFNVFGLDAEAAKEEGRNWRQLLDRTRSLSSANNCYIILPMLVFDEGFFINRAYVTG